MIRLCNHHTREEVCIFVNTREVMLVSVSDAMEYEGSAAVATSINDDIQIGKEEEDNDDGLTESLTPVGVSKFRRCLPQVLATAAQSLLLLALGMLIAVPTMIIAALHNAKSGLSMNDQQASWFAGLLLGFQPTGSILSGISSDILGRKKCMLLVSVPQFIGWMLVYTANSIPPLYAAAAMMGFTIGFMEAPTLSYIGEISEPEFRATLASMTSVQVSIGHFLMYLLGTITPWRTSAAISASIPVITVIAILQVPESPIWLLRKDKSEQARKALCWLRGWVQPELVEREFISMSAYCQASRRQATSGANHTTSKDRIYIEVPKNGNGPRLHEIPARQPGTLFMEKIRDLLRPEMRRPLRLVITFFFFYHCAALSGFKPYMVNIFQRLKLPLEPHWFTVTTGLLQIGGGLICVSIVHRTGKRLISMVSMATCSMCCLFLGAYTLFNDRGMFEKPWLPLALFATLFFFTNVAISPIPWTLISEVYPSRGRGIAGGISAAAYYVFFFAVTKTFLDLQSYVELYGAFFLYGGLGMCGLVYLYCCLPETSGKTLNEIEKLFAVKRQPINGIH